jgi:hypothetical protein
MIYAKKEQTERGRQESNKLLRLMAKKQILKLTMESMDGKITEKEVYHDESRESESSTAVFLDQTIVD